MRVTIEEIRKILQVIEDSDVYECQLELGDLKLTVRKGEALDPGVPREAEKSVISEMSVEQAAAPTSPPATAGVASARSRLPQEGTSSQAAVDFEGFFAVRAPSVGTFYRASGPGAPPFCEVGDKVRAEDTVGLIEIMKLFNSVAAGADGEVAKILVDSEAPVEYDQPLMLIEPESPSAARAHGPVQRGGSRRSSGERSRTTSGRAKRSGTR